MINFSCIHILVMLEYFIVRKDVPLLPGALRTS